MTVLATEDEARMFVAERGGPKAVMRLEAFASLLSEANQTQNLVSPGSLESVWLRHIADSAQLLDHVPRETGAWLDIGTGAGFPGLVLAMLDQERRYIIVESRKLRVQWLASMIDRLGVSNCTVLGSDVAKIDTFQAGVISARALAPLDRLIALSARFSTSSTRWVLPKGRSAEQEVSALPAHLRAMFHVKQSCTDPDAGIVVGAGRVESMS